MSLNIVEKDKNSGSKHKSTKQSRNKIIKNLANSKRIQIVSVIKNF